MVAVDDLFIFVCLDGNCEPIIAFFLELGVLLIETALNYLHHFGTVCDFQQ